VWFSENKIIELLDKNIHNYSIPKEHSEDIKKALYDYHYTKVENNYKSKEQINSLIEKLENKKSSYMEMRASDEISHEEFINVKN
jgi:hypothetical protein